VLIGGSSALVTQMFLAVEVGRLLTLFPVNVKNFIVGLFFLGGAAYLLFVPEKKEEERGEREGARVHTASRWREITTAYTVLFIGEMGDLTQIQAANLSARTHQPLEVFLAASLALVCVTFVASSAARCSCARCRSRRSVSAADSSSRASASTRW